MNNSKKNRELNQANKFDVSRKLNAIQVKRLLLVILSMFLMTAFYSCKKASEKVGEKMIEKSIGDDATVDIDYEKVTIETEEGKFTTDAKATNWPKEIPKDIPEFKNGKVTAVTTQDVNGSNNWVIIFGDLSENALEDYKTNLKGEGFTIIFSTTAGMGGHMAAEKDKYNVMLMAAEGDATVTVGVKN